jgi:heme oxygenase (biliverdin-producing, ferredoxin)
MLERVSDAGRELRPASLLEALRERTRELHATAERTGIVAEILHRRADLFGYALLLRNLLPVYRTMEEALAAHRGSAVVGLLVRPELDRAGAIESDLRAISDRYQISDLPELPESIRYADAIRQASEGTAVRLMAHAYARYLGDLSGGQILRKLIQRSLDLPPEALTFYEFPKIPDIAAFKAEYRSAIERAGDELGDFAPVVEESARAFELNIELSSALQDATLRRR